MRPRTLILFLVALMLAGGTAILVRSWLAQRATQAEAAPALPPAPQKSILVARDEIARGQILKPADLTWEPWSERSIHRAYVQEGTKTIDAFSGWVARAPFGPGEPITEGKIVSPGSRGFLAATLQPGMRAVSVPVNRNSDVSGFVLPGDHVDIVITHSLSAPGSDGGQFQHKAAETVLRDVRVLAADQKLDSKSGEAIVAQNVTLEVTPKQSEMVAVASEMGKLSLSLRSLATSTTGETAADSSDDAVPGTFTLDTQVSRLLPKRFTPKGKPKVHTVTILHGSSRSEEVSYSQLPSRGL